MDISKPIVEIQGLTKIYNGSKLAVNQMNLIIPRRLSSANPNTRTASVTKA